MKKMMFTKSIIALILVWMFNLSASAISPKNYVYNEKKEGENVVEKLIFTEEGGFLQRVLKYEFSYNTDNLVTEKKAYRWNTTKEDWEPHFQVSYQYGNEGENITYHYVLWDKKTKKFCLNEQILQMSPDDYETIFS